MDLLPSQIIRYLQAGVFDKVLDCSAIGLCVSCHTCSSRCPQEVDFAEVMGELKRTVSQAGKKTAGFNQALFNRTFVGMIRYLGRIYEAGLIGIYNFRSRQFFKDLDLVPEMLWKRKLKLFPAILLRRGGHGRVFKWLKI